ncbi:MAG: hypothetical protein QNJ53_11335 [Pleurocapsa sp. MO_192.B19]|nr:hypothetical protein [Pleurocapsa sp. MO_192.B19]
MLLQVPTKPKDDGFNELTDALKQCSSIKDSQRRKDIISFLEDIEIADRDTTSSFVIGILKAFSGIPERFDELIEAISYYDKNQQEFDNLIIVIKDIALKQQELEGRSTKKIKLFGEAELNNNTQNQSFKNLWNELSFILKEIEWKNVWNACSKIEQINKHRGIYLKSLCFTQNYELLKQLFLDKYDPTLVVEFAELLRPYNKKKINIWLNKANRDLGQNKVIYGKKDTISVVGAYRDTPLQRLMNTIKIWYKYFKKSPKVETEPDRNEDKSYYSPILLIIVEKFANGEEQDKLSVRGQLKYQGKQSEIMFSSNTIGEICYQFKDIPAIIKKYIDFLETDSRFRNARIDQLRIEVFLPLVELNCNFDDWLSSSAVNATEQLVVRYRIFLRSRERARKNSRISLLIDGWKKLKAFFDSDYSEISQASFAKISDKIDKFKTLHLIEISEKDTIDWFELEIYMQECPNLWGVNWKSSLSSSVNERMKFFQSIYHSGIPIAFWNWDDIPEGVEFEKKFKECLSKNSLDLDHRCEKLLELTWKLRKFAWGHDRTKRKQYPGYYLGMLLEDPEILPEEEPLQTIGVKQ